MALALAGSASLAGLTGCGYQQIPRADNAVSAAWAEVENQYQRRADLVPNLVATVQGYATHERQTLQAVIEARAKATQVNINADQLTPENLQKFEAAQGQLTSSLSRLLVVAENYPQLKANQNFLELQSQLEGTENRITVERRRFNEVAQSYNTRLRSAPTNFIAAMFNFKERPYFEAVAGAETAPRVNFGGTGGQTGGTENK